MGSQLFFYSLVSTLMSYDIANEDNTHSVVAVVTRKRLSVFVFSLLCVTFSCGSDVALR